jgi:hypothetical protein
MAPATAVVRRRTTFDDFAQHVVERPDEFRCRGVVALFKFSHLLRLATRDDHGDFMAVMNRTLQDRLPLFDNAGCRVTVAFQAGFAFR